MLCDEHTSIAVLMTCHNRREATLKCLASLHVQKLPQEAGYHAYLVDDGSEDGTGRAVADRFSAVTVLEGNGHLYWNGGMRVAWAKAMEGDYDHYLWLNDDAVLLPGAITRLLETAREVHRREGRAGIVVGSCRDPETGQHTYGGRIKRHSRLRLADKLLPPGKEMLPCETMNGNVVLVPRQVTRILGNLSDDYTHTFGDVDYGMRARQAGISVWIAPGYVAECSRNTRLRRWIDPRFGLIERWRDMCSPHGLPPRQWYTYVKRHTGWAWPIYFVKPLVRVLFPWLWTVRQARSEVAAPGAGPEGSGDPKLSVMHFSR